MSANAEDARDSSGPSPSSLAPPPPHVGPGPASGMPTRPPPSPDQLPLPAMPYAGGATGAGSAPSSPLLAVASASLLHQADNSGLASGLPTPHWPQDM